MNNETIEQLKKFGFKLHEESANFLILKARFFTTSYSMTSMLELMKLNNWDFNSSDYEFNRYFFKKVQK